MQTIEEKHRISDELTNFLIDRRSQKLSPSTISFYKEKLAVFLKRCNSKGIEYVEDVTPSFLREYFIELGKTHNAGGVHIFFRTVKTFLNWFSIETDDAAPNPIKKIRGPKLSSTPIPGITLDDIQRMLDTCDHSLTGLRDQAAIRFLVDTGVRRAEFCNVRILDVDMLNGSVKIVAGKGNKDRTVFLSATSRRDLMRYLRKRKTKDPREYLWITQSRTQLTYSGLRQMLRRHAELAKIPCPSPHDFRRTFALECLRNGMGLIQLMYLMGHTTTIVLQRYLAVQEDDLRGAHSKSGPIEQNEW